MNGSSGKLLGIAALIIAVIALVHSFATAGGEELPKYGYTDITVLLSKYAPAVAVRQEIDKQLVPLQQRLQETQIEVQALEIRYKNNKDDMSEGEVAALDKLYQNAQRRRAEIDQEIRGRGSALEARLMQPVYAELNRYLTEFGDANGYSMIWAATSSGNLAYATEAADVTDALLEYIAANPRDVPVGGAAAPAPAAPAEPADKATEQPAGGDPK